MNNLKYVFEMKKVSLKVDAEYDPNYMTFSNRQQLIEKHL